MQLFTPAKVAEMFQVSEAFVLERCRSWEWPCQKLGSKTYRFSEENLREILGLTERKPEKKPQPMTREQRRRLRTALGGYKG